MSGIGIKFPDTEDWWAGTKANWAQTNYTLVKSMTGTHINLLNSVAEQAVINGWSVKMLSSEIHKLDNKLSNSKVKLIARDQIGKLNGMVTQARMESLGLTMYIWATAKDERVRGYKGGHFPNAIPSHALMEGKLCRWSDSTVYSEDGGKTWIPRPSGAVLLHPGLDIMCRCIARNYWEELVGEVDAEIAAKENTANELVGKPQTAPATQPPKAKPKTADPEIRDGWSSKFYEILGKIQMYNNVKETVLIERNMKILRDQGFSDEKDFAKKINNYIKENKSISRFDLDEVLKYWADEPIQKNQFETGTSNGALSADARNAWEKVITGIKADTMKPRERAVYGASYLVYKDAIRNRSTFTISNSSNKSGAFTDNALAVFNKGRSQKNALFREAIGKTADILDHKGHSYMETQIWGSADLRKDVEKIVIGEKDVDYLQQNMVLWNKFKTQMDDAGVKIEI